MALRRWPLATRCRCRAANIVRVRPPKRLSPAASTTKVRGPGRRSRSAADAGTRNRRAACNGAQVPATKPTASNERASGHTPDLSSASSLALKPIAPTQAAGILTLPAVSVPSARSARPPATAAPAPLEEPPAIRVASSGLRTPTPVTPNPPASVRVIPTRPAPAVRRRATTGAVRRPRRPANSG